MDLQYHGGNAISLGYKGARVVIDDTLSELGGKSIVKPDDVALFTNPSHSDSTARLVFDRPGEYEVSEISITGIPVRSHIDETDKKGITMFKLTAGDVSMLITGHIHPDLTNAQIEAIGVVDVLILPVGGNGYTLDPLGALKVIKEIEPKIVIPTHYADKDLKYPVPQQELANALKEMAMEPKETVSKLKVKSAELSDVAQLIILEKV
jgi:L-ascorbate metabolism protein UlaG (beta-lactamase superfamily)